MEQVRLVLPARRAWPAGRRFAVAVAMALPGLWASSEGPAAFAQTTACDVAAPPPAAFTANCTSMTCTFNVASQPPAGGDFAWDFGDGNAADGPALQATNTYMVPGAYEVILTVRDANGQIGAAMGTVNVGSSPPLAADDAFVTDENTPLTITTAELLANDAPGVIFVQADASKCYVAPGGTSCTYTPASGFIGTDSFTYSVRDVAGNTGSATVTITVEPVLIANPDFFTTYAGVPIQISTSQLLANDTMGAVFVSAQGAQNGSLGLVTAGPPPVYSFTPSPSFVGDAYFDYLIGWNVDPSQARGIVTVKVIDAPPKASFTVVCVNRTCTVHTTSSDPDSTPVARWLWNWGDGTPTIEPTSPYPWADQTHTYAAAGRYTITHTVYDTAGQMGSTQLPVLADTAPTAADDAANTDRDVPLTVDVLANDSDPDGDPLSISGVDLLTNYPGAAFQVVQLNGRWAIQVTPPNAFVGTITFTYRPGMELLLRVRRDRPTAVQLASAAIRLRLPRNGWDRALPARPPDGPPGRRGAAGRHAVLK